MAIDLSKIKHNELPVTKDYAIRICGVEQKTDIKPVVGEAALEFWGTLNVNVHDEPLMVRKRVMICLVSGCGMSEEDAKKLIYMDWEASLSLAGKVREVTLEYQASLAKEREEAEKNSGNADAPDTQN